MTYAISTLRKRCTLFGTQGNQTLFRLSADPTPTLQRSSRTFVINVQVLRKMRYIHNHGRYVMCVMYISFYCEVMGCHGGYDIMPCHATAVMPM